MTFEDPPGSCLPRSALLDLFAVCVNKRYCSAIFKWCVCLMLPFHWFCSVTATKWHQISFVPCAFVVLVFISMFFSYEHIALCLFFDRFTFIFILIVICSIIPRDDSCDDGKLTMKTTMMIIMMMVEMMTAPILKCFLLCTQCMSTS